MDSEQRPVRANLHKSLSHLRDCFVERILWIDAIYINQANDKEKGHQVESMAKIYAKASGVIVWLGEAADGSDRATKAIRRAAEDQAAEDQDADVSAYQAHWRVISSPDQMPINFKSNDVDQQSVDSEINEMDQQAIFTLLEREWFQRIWVSRRQRTILIRLIRVANIVH